MREVIGVILPIHFTALASLAWPNLKPLIITGAGFVLTPIAGRYLHDYQIFIVPFVLGGFFLLWDTGMARRDK